MTEINLDQPIFELDGKTAIEGTHLGQTIAGALAQNNEGDALKAMHWAKTLYAKEPLQLDDSDLEVFKAFVKGAKTLTNYVKGPALEIINKAQK